jgi:FixJ family two-component response regulator
MKSKNINKLNIFVVDDDIDIRSSIASALNNLGYNVTCFAGAKECLKSLSVSNCNLLITDVRMPDIDGIQLLIKTKRISPALPVLLITGFGDVRMAVNAIKMGAADFIEKPFDKKYIISKVQGILKKYEINEDCSCAPLTNIQKKVLKLILEGKSNKQIAALIERSSRTVELHRHNIMHKFEAESYPDLVRKASNHIR